MKKHLLISLFYIILIVSAIMVLAFASQRTIGSNFHELNSRAQSIVSSLSLREKIGQMLQLDAWSFLRSYPSKDIDMEKLRTYILDYNVGSFLNNMLNITEWIEMITTIQKIAMSSNSRIPVLYGIDSVHGANYVIGATLFPHFGTSACAFRPDLLVKQGEITAKDTRTVGIPWVFSPILEVGANVVWSRVYEVFGEDPYLTTVLGQAIISGLTSNNLQNVTKCAVCMKHFIGYSYPRTGKDHTNSEISERFLRENLLPPFRGAAKMVQTVMLSMGSINGEPVTSSRRYAKDLLNEIGFEGLVVTDYLAIQQLVDHYKIVNNKREAIKLALNAGVDMAMWVQGTDFSDILYDMVKSGQVPETRIDVSVAKIINLKLQLGLFDNPYPDPNSQYIKTIGSRQDRDVALELARESIVLLKNENNLLPISPTKTKGILATGPSMNSVCLLNGGWSARWEGCHDPILPFGETLLSSIQKIVGENKVKYVKGCDFDRPDLNSLQEAIKIAKSGSVDTIIIAVGEPNYAEVLGNINNLALSDPQMQLIQQLRETGVNIVLVLVQGRPRTITWASINIDAIIHAGLPGSEGGQAIAEILFGIVNPSGKLVISYPSGQNNIEPYWHQIPEFQQYPVENPKPPYWSFGHGLSYTHFKYLNLTLSKNNIKMSDSVEISITLRNDGPMDGKETVLLFVRDEVASVTPAVKRLKRFDKVFLKVGQSIVVNFKITPETDLGFIGLENKYMVEPGEFTIMVGDLTGKLLVQ